MQYIVFNNLKFTVKHLKRSYMFRSYDHPQGAYFVPCFRKPVSIEQRTTHT